MCLHVEYFVQGKLHIHDNVELGIFSVPIGSAFWNIIRVMASPPVQMLQMNNSVDQNATTRLEH